MDIERLKEPFKADQIEWRIGQSGLKDGRPWAKVLAYVDARAVAQRLDSVCGPLGWQKTYRYINAPPVVDDDGKPQARDGFICALSVWDKDGERWVTREDGAGMTDFEPVKGGLSGAFKRAAAAFGVGAYLYQLEEGWAETSKDTRKYPNWGSGFDKRTKERFTFSWRPPQLPSWALPEGSGRAPEDPPPESQGEAPEDKGEAGKGRKRGAVLLSGAQMGQIRALQAEIGLSEEELHKGVMHHYGRESLSDLTRAEARGLLERLEARRAAQLKDEAEEAFGGDGRLGKLRAQAMGYCATMERMGMRLVNGEPVRLQNVGLAVESLEELRELLQCSQDEKELESVILKLERVLEAMSF